MKKTRSPKLPRGVAVVAVVAACGVAGGVFAGTASAASPTLNELANVGAGGVEGNNLSSQVAISGSGRFVVFTSSATNLTTPAPASPQAGHIYLRDRLNRTTTLISKRPDGVAAKPGSGSPAISFDGSVIAFVSRADDLVANDTNGKDDIFVYRAGVGVTRVVGLDNEQPDGHSAQPAVSGDGHAVVFATDAENMVQTDGNGVRDIVWAGIESGITRTVSRTPEKIANKESAAPTISFLGTLGSARVAFESAATNLVPGDTNGVKDVFLTRMGAAGPLSVTRVSVAGDGKQANGPSYDPAISHKGDYVAYTSGASNLVANDKAGHLDVFRHSVNTKSVQRMSLRAWGNEPNGASYDAAISGDGRRVHFTSTASNMVSGDTNGHMADVYSIYDAAARFGARKVSLDLDGTSTDNHSFGASVAANGVVGAFISRGSGLVPGQENDFGRDDVFVVTLK